jgi:pyruvate-formate lyase-activating enzyme
MNVLLSDYCNRRCAFCFGGDYIKRSSAHAKYMDIDAFKKVLAFAERSQLKRITLLGGEPTTNPQLTDIIGLCREAQLSIQMFSNGILTRKTAETLRRQTSPDWFNVTVNYRDPALVPKAEARAVQRTFTILHDRLNLGVTISDENEDLDFVVRAIAKWNLKKVIRLGISSPSFFGDNQSIVPERFHKYGELVAGFAESCDREGISLGFDCGFTPCMFSPEQLGRIFRSAALPKFERCRYAIDIGPDLTAWPCFPLLGAVQVNLSDFYNETELRAHFVEQLSPYYSFGAMEECPQCSYFLRAMCQGGCLGYVVSGFDRPSAVGAESTGEKHPTR